MVEMEQALNNLGALRIHRAESIRETMNDPDPQSINNMIADAINLLEAIYVKANIPMDGFISFTPEHE